MSLATVCASAWLRCGMGAPAPGVWIGSTESAQAEMVEFAREALRMTVEAHEWQALTQTYTVALADGPEQTIALPADFGRLVPGTVWLSDRAWAVEGPVSEVEYELLRQPPAASSGPVFRISGGALQLLATPSPGGDLTLRYITAHPVTSGGGSAATYQTDSDFAKIDERMVTLGLIYLWRDSKGLDAQAAALMYRSAVAYARSQDRPVGVLSMARRARGDAPHANADGTVDARL